MDSSRYFPIDANIYLFYCSLKKMEFNGYDVLHFKYIIDEIENVLINYEKGIILELPFNLNDIIHMINILTYEIFGFSMKNLKSQRLELLSYIAKNNSSGIIKLVYFSSIEKEISADDLTVITDIIKPISLALTGNENSSQVTFFHIELILNNEPKPNPKKKILEMINFEYTLREYILLLPFNNIMQTQFITLNENQKKKLLSEINNKSQFPSVSLSHDKFLQYSEVKHSEKNNPTILGVYGKGPSNLMCPISLEYRVVNK